MTNLEMTKLCAAAMELEIAYVVSDDVFVLDGVKLGPTIYSPLRNDAQAMALVKRLELEIVRHGGNWDVSPRGDVPVGLNADLNRAIVECVAKMRATESKLVRSQENVTGQISKTAL